MAKLMAQNTTARAAYDLDQLKQLVGDILQQAKDLGATSAEAGVNSEAGFSVTVRMGEVETIEYNRDKGLGVTVYFGQRKGSASTTDFRPHAVSETVRAAVDIARYTAEDEYAGLADPALMARDIPDLQLYQPWDITPDAAVEMAKECEAAAFAVDKRLHNSEGAYIATHSGARVYGNSNGFVGGYPSSRHSLGCTMIGRENDEMQRDHWYSLSRNPAGLEAAVSVGQKAAQRTVERLSARKIQTGKLPVIFSAEAARGLLGHFIRAINGSALYRKSSFLLDSLGQAIFPDFIEIQEQPHLLQGLGSSPFDSEGVSTRERRIIEAGVLQGYVLDSYAARHLGMQTTGNAGGVHNLSINHQAADLDALLRQMDKGILVTEVMGQGVNIVTGDYSRGAGGFWVEGGEIQYPIEEFTLAGNLRQMYRGLQAVAGDVDRRGNLLTGSWLIDEMTIAGD
ncbi:MAG: metalloprotease PmbA [Gammaproteobacteria bacterium]|nr:metalloprotease PmbA [Gammaproteobacteria bacterium]MDH5653662.1 metalloprotease PmbA [Gammaproteobacteria bacterium]